MEETPQEIQAKIDRLELNLRLKKYQYKKAFDEKGGWDEAKKLHNEIKSIEQQLLVERSRLP